MKGKGQPQHWSMATDPEEDPLWSRADPRKGRRGKTTSPTTSRSTPYDRPDQAVDLCDDEDLSIVLPVSGQQVSG